LRGPLRVEPRADCVGALATYNQLQWTCRNPIARFHLSSQADFREVCESTARAAGRVLLDWAGRFSVREKGPADLVTEADLASQELVREKLLGAFPLHGFLAEENSAIPSRDQGYRWIVDPLDGTTNYVHGIPNYAVSIALERAGQLIVGTVFDPVGEECYTAAVGEGAFLNGRRLHVSQIAQLSQAVVAMSFPAGIKRGDPELNEFMNVVVRAQTMRRTGSSALNLCYLAAGRFDAYWSTSTKVWDIAAGALMVSEAGGYLTSRAGGQFVLEPPHFLAAATPELHRELSDALAHAA
jgi:myo-inositol-1(or 4)-monophosphatase